MVLLCWTKNLNEYESEQKQTPWRAGPLFAAFNEFSNRMVYGRSWALWGLWTHCSRYCGMPIFTTIFSWACRRDMEVDQVLKGSHTCCQCFWNENNSRNYWSVDTTPARSWHDTVELKFCLCLKWIQCRLLGSWRHCSLHHVAWTVPVFACNMIHYWALLISYQNIRVKHCIAKLMLIMYWKQTWLLKYFYY